MGRRDKKKKRTWCDRGSAEDNQNNQDSKKNKGTVATVISKNCDSSKSTAESPVVESGSESDSDSDSVFHTATEGLSSEQDKMAAGGQNVDIVSQLILALQDPGVMNKITNMVTKAVEKSLKAEISDLKTKVQKLEETVCEKDEIIGDMQDQLHDMQQYSRRNSLRIFGFPETNGENTDEIILFLANKLNVKMSLDEISRSHRVGKVDETSAAPRPIIVCFLSYRTRHQFYKARIKLKSTPLVPEPTISDDAHQPDNDNDQPDNEQENMDIMETDPVAKVLGTTNPVIYINEDLSKQRAALAAQCRTLKRQDKIVDTWTYDGTIFVKLKNQRILRINKNSEFQELSEHLSLKVKINLSQKAASASVFG